MLKTESHETPNHPAKNPVERVFEKKQPFIYFHTHEVTKEILDSGIQAGKSLEVDVSMDEGGQIFIGHPLSFYEFKHMAPPDNLPFEPVVEALKKSGIYLVLDCKDARSLPRIKEIVTDFGSDRVLFHAWVDKLLFKPYPPEITVEPHWPYEDLTYDEVVDLHKETGVSVILSSRGLTQERLAEEGETVTNQILEACRGVASAVNFSLPNGKLPPKEIVDRLLSERILTWMNIDQIDADSRPELYLGASDFIENVSNPKDFQ